jgi:adenylate cyclase class IV
MPSNIEIKARVLDPGHLHSLARQVSGHEPQLILQHDTFFPCPRGRLKLRQFSEDSGELIAYSRPDQTGAKLSDYRITRTSTPALLRETLSMALGTGVVVEKRRQLYLVGQTRIHCDEVAGLGHFMELEVVLRAGQTVAEGERIARDLMQALELDAADLIDGAYADLIIAAQTDS